MQKQSLQDIRSLIAPSHSEATARVRESRAKTINAIEIIRQRAAEEDFSMHSLTRVRLTFIRDQTNVWLRFGYAVKERIVDSYRRDVYFTPHTIFGCVTWHGTVSGTTEWRIDVLRAIALREQASQISNVTPGAEILLRVSGASKVPVLLTLFDKIEATGIHLIGVSPDYWRCTHNRFAANQDISVLTADAHSAFQSRRKFLL